MNYKLIDGSLNDTVNPKKTILLNRGITQWKAYLNLKADCLYDYKLLDNIDIAVKKFIEHLDIGSHIHIIIDSDVDGYTSGSMVYRYIKYVSDKSTVSYSLHTKKQHGLTNDIEIPDSCKLLIIPDAGTNDDVQCKALKNKGMNIIILDHHLCDKSNNDAIIVNNQMCDYPNKNLCGAGIVYKFLKAVDAELWEDYADKMLDMVALGNISDVMDMREFETRYLVNLGLSKIRSKLFKALIEKQSYSMNNIVNIISVQFYITPILNAMIRIGSEEDKEVLFRAFIETDESFKHKKRGEETETIEDIYTRAARICANAKVRQDKEVKNGVEKIDDIIKEKDLSKNKVMFVNVSNVLGETLTGLVAIKIAEKYNRPCLLLRKQNPKENGELYYGGSCRNFNDSPIDSLKDFLDSTGSFDFIQGHDNAAGLSIKRDNVTNAINICNEKLKSINFEKCYKVDFCIDFEELSVSFIKSIDEMKDLFGQGVKEPLVYVSNISVYREDILIMGKNQNSWKITYDCMAIVDFNVDVNEDQLLSSYRHFDNNEFTDEEDDEKLYGLIGYMNVVGTVSVNNYNNILTPQVIVKDYEYVDITRK